MGRQLLTLVGGKGKDTMPKEFLNPKELFDSRKYGFSQIVTVTGGKMVFMSGQVAWDENQQIIGGQDLGAQARQALENIRTGLESAGGTLTDVVSMRIYIKADQMDNSRGVRQALLEFFPGEKPPATTWIAVHSLANPEFLIEIEPIAVIEG